MKLLQGIAIPFKLPRRSIEAGLVLILFTVIPLLVLRTSYDSYTSSSSSSPSPSQDLHHHIDDHIQTIRTSEIGGDHYHNHHHHHQITSGDVNEKAEEKEEGVEDCDIFTGEWVPNTDGPYYTNETCWAIHEHQNCMKYGRPDSEFMKWRWKPDGCDLPIFNPHQFLEIVRGKSLVFVGDSVARNQMQSLICLLSRVEYPIDKSYTSDELFKRWYYVSYNFTLAIYTSTFLVRARQDDPRGPSGTGLFGLHLHDPDPAWAQHIDPYDYVIISAAHWFYRSLLLFDLQGHLFGCRFCELPNVTDYSMPFIYRRAFRTAFAAILARPRFKGTVYLRTFSPSHFEGGLWNEGGNCLRQKPFRSSKAVLEGMNLDMYMAQVEEFRAAKREAKKRGLRFRLLDTTQATLMRPDGHPSRYGHWPEEKVVLYNDCVHWCLPGPIDTWNDFLLEMMRNEGVLMAKEKREQQEEIKKKTIRFK